MVGEVEPRRHQQGYDAEAEQRCGEAESPLGETIRPGHAEVGDVPPAVDAGEGQRRNEQHHRGEHRTVAPRPQHVGSDSDGGQCPQCSGQTGEYPEVVSPLGRGEHHRQQGDDSDPDNAPAGSRRGAWNVPAAQRHCHRYRQCHQHRQHREPAGDRPVRGGQEQPLVAQVLVEPTQAGSDGTLEGVGPDFTGKGLVAEDQDQPHGGRSQNRGQQGCQTELPGAPADDGPQRPDGHQQRTDRRNPGRSGEQRQRPGDAGDRHRQQPTGGHSPLHRAPGRHNAQRDDRFGTQTVVQGQPEREEQSGCGPRRRVACPDCVAESGDDLAADEPPARNGHQQGGQPHPDTGGRHLCPPRQQVVVPAERSLRGAEPAVVVGRVAGVPRYPRHGQDVAVVGGVGADEVPPGQYGDHQGVQPGRRPPPRRCHPPPAGPVCGVESMQRDQRDDGEQQAEHHHRRLQRRRRTAVAGVDGRREIQARRCRSGQVGEDPDDLRPQVRPAALAVATKSDEFAGDFIGVGGHGKSLAGRAEYLFQRGRDDRGVAHHDHQ